MSVVRTSWRARKRLQPLTQPPDLGSAAISQHRPRPETTPEQKLNNLFGGGNTKGGLGTVEHQKNVGNEGSKTKSRQHLIDTLARGGSTPREGLDGRLLRLVYGLSFMVWNEYWQRQLLDVRWCEAFATAAAVAVRAAGHGAPTEGAPMICVLGVGSCVAALSAARAGAAVLWLDRVARFVEVAEQVTQRNGYAMSAGTSTSTAGAVRVGRIKEWAGFNGGGNFDAVVTEEIEDDLLGGGVLGIARHAHENLLRPGGRFVPSRARVYAALASLRVDTISDFDLSAFNAFRNNASVWVDLEHIAATDRYGKQQPRLLSNPVHLFDFDFSSLGALPPNVRTLETCVVACAEGIVNCVTWWYELELGDDAPCLPLGPNLGEGALPFDSRARRQKLIYLGYERRVAANEPVSLLASHDATKLTVGPLAPDGLGPK